MESVCPSCYALLSDYALVQLLIRQAFVIKQSSSNQEVAELINNKQCPSDQLTALTYYVYINYPIDSWTIKMYNFKKFVQLK